MRLKHNVRLRTLNGEVSGPMLVGCRCVEDAFDDVQAGYCMATSVMDGAHSKGSRHGWGDAVDFRTRHVPRQLVGRLVARVKEFCGPEFDVVLEHQDESNEHLHVEYDPD